MLFDKKINKRVEKKIETRKHSRDDIKKWRDNEVLPILKEYDLLPKSIYTICEYPVIFIISALILGAVFAGVAIYGFESGGFASNINQSVNVDPQINTTVNNDYFFTPETQNQYKFDMPNITVNCPEQICQCVCGES